MCPFLLRGYRTTDTGGGGIALVIEPLAIAPDREYCATGTVATILGDRAVDADLSQAAAGVRWKPTIR